MLNSSFNRNSLVLPTQNRKCTDIFCALLFLIATGASVYAALYGFTKGDLNNIIPPYDSSGNRCGQGALKDFGYLHFKEVTPTSWVKANACVKECPTVDKQAIDCYLNKQITNCSQLPSVPTYSFGKRFCWPKNSKMEGSIRDKFKTLGRQEAYGDIVDSWQVFLICAAIAFVVSLIYLLILEQCALVLISLVIVLFLAGMTFLTYYFHQAYNELQNDSDPHNDGEKTFLYLAIITASIEVILILCFCCMWSRIKLAARIIQATADYITDIKRIIVVPVIMMFALISYLLWWSYSGAYLFSVGHTEHDPKLPWGDMKWTQLTE